LPVATRAGGELERRALYVLAWPRALRGRPLDDLCRRFAALEDAGTFLAESPERVAGQQLVWRGSLDAARALLERQLALADERGQAYAYVLQRLHMCELELRAGAWDAAERLLDEWAQSSERLMWSMYERCRALLAAGRGLPAEAERWAAETIAGTEATGNDWDRLEALRARGIAALLAGAPERAEESLRAVLRHVEDAGVEEPGVFPVAPELVEALVELGRRDEAREVAEQLSDRAEAQEHPWGLASAKRCLALVELGSDSYDDDAAEALTQAADAYAEMGLLFDRSRARLGLGRAQRRFKKWGAARESLERAAADFGALESPGWAEQARSELERVGGRRRATESGAELTPTERQVAELAADGLANKEIASSLFVSVRTVEVHLKHAYAKLGIRSRTQLARRLSG
jgi:DNA-binding NarL/FixJ family response regulator